MARYLASSSRFATPGSPGILAGVRIDSQTKESRRQGCLRSRHNENCCYLARISCLIIGLLAWSAVWAEGSAPLPSADFILERVVKRAQLEDRNDHDFKQLYGFSTFRLRQELDSKGRVKKRHERRRVNEPDLESEPVLYMPRESEAGPQIDEMDEREAAALVTDGKAFSRSDFSMGKELLERFEFKPVGREAWEGRSVLVMDFEPANRRLPVRHLKDRLINRAAGRAWIDEEDWAVARVELRLTEPVKVLGGLVGVLRDFDYRLQRRRSHDGLWYTSHVDWRLEGRQVLVNKVVVSRERKEDVRRVRW
jgi:hypothetical protein